MPGQRSPGSLPGNPGSELDRALHELVERAGEVVHSQDRLRSLLRATQAVVEPDDWSDGRRRLPRRAPAVRVRLAC